MQTEDPTLPEMCLDGRKSFTGKRNSDARVSPAAGPIRSTCRSAAHLVSNRKQLHPLHGGPCKSAARLYSLAEPVKPLGKGAVGQRVVSAKMLRVKQLQNQLADAHYHLNELANENRLLKALQKRQDYALKRYEGASAELPRIINSHHEELRVLQAKYKKLKAQCKGTCDLLKEKENELHSLQNQNKHLQRLSKDRNLLEREKLRMQVSDLNHRLELQQETIQTLNRKLTLEGKSLKHQLNVEAAKHRETQKHLHEALEKLKSLEELLDNREKRLYFSGQLPAFNKGKTAGSRSLTNLGDRSSTTNLLKLVGKSNGSRNEVQSEMLPTLTETESSDVKVGRAVPNSSVDSPSGMSKTETMTSFERVRKFRLGKARRGGGEGSRLRDDGGGGRMIEARAEEEEDEDEATESNVGSLSEFMERRRLVNYERELERIDSEREKEFGYSSDESDGEKADPSRRSKELHARLVNAESRHSDVEQLIASDKTQFTEEELDRITVRRTKFKRESVTRESTKKVTAQTGGEATRSVSESDSDVDAELEAMEERDAYRQSWRREQDELETEKVERTADDILKFDSRADVSSDSAGSKSPGRDADEASERLSSGGEFSVARRHLMDITKSWRELQDKIAKEREISESQIKELEDNAESDSDGESGNDLRASERRSPSPRKTEGSSSDADDRVEGNKSSRDHLGVRTNADESMSGSGEPLATDSSRLEDSGKMFDGEDPPAKHDEEDDPRERSRKLVERDGPSGAEYREEMSREARAIHYNKEKLLAAMRAIDDNENVEFLDAQKSRRSSVVLSSRLQITENLYRGLPTHARKKDDLMKEIFGNGKPEGKTRNGCGKLH